MSGTQCRHDTQKPTQEYHCKNQDAASAPKDGFVKNLGRIASIHTHRILKFIARCVKHNVSWLVGLRTLYVRMSTLSRDILLCCSRCCLQSLLYDTASLLWLFADASRSRLGNAHAGTPANIRVFFLTLTFAEIFVIDTCARSHCTSSRSRDRSRCETRAQLTLTQRRYCAFCAQSNISTENLARVKAITASCPRSQGARRAVAHRRSIGITYIGSVDAHAGISKTSAFCSIFVAFVLLLRAFAGPLSVVWRVSSDLAIFASLPAPYRTFCLRVLWNV